MSAPIVQHRGVSVLAAPWETPIERRAADPAPVIAPVVSRPGKCIVPGCSKSVRFDNRQGVCRDHQHARGFCKCVQCQRNGR